uniref:Uncharacterized protein n=1 Tax=Panagrolaimus sp. JU765 TaxID=591449 RepID=A0AC34QD80_9BILA
MKNKLESSKVLTQVFSNEKYALKFLAEKLTAQEGKVKSSEALKGESDVDGLMSLNPETIQALEKVEIPEFWSQNDGEVKVKDQETLKVEEIVKTVTETTPKPTEEMTEAETSTTETTTLAKEEPVTIEATTIPAHESITTATTPEAAKSEEKVPKDLPRNSGEAKVKDQETPKVEEIVKTATETTQKSTETVTEAEASTTETTTTVSKEEPVTEATIPAHESITAATTPEVAAKSEEKVPKDLPKNSGEAKLKSDDGMDAKVDEELEEMPEDREKTASEEEEEKILDPKMAQQVAKKLDEMSKTTAVPAHESILRKLTTEQMPMKNDDGRENINSGEALVETLQKDAELEKKVELLETKTEKNGNSTVVPAGEEVKDSKIEGVVSENDDKPEILTTLAPETVQSKEETESKIEKSVGNSDNVSATTTTDDSKLPASSVTDATIDENSESQEETASEDMFPKYESEEKPEELTTEKDWENEAAEFLQNKKLAEQISEKKNEDESDSELMEGSGEEMMNHPKSATFRLK